MTTPILPDLESIGNINLDLLTEQIIEVAYNTSPAFDFKSGDFIIAGGNIQFRTEKENLEQWIVGVLDTAINTFVVYSQTHGNPVINLIHAMSPEVLEVIVPRIIRFVLLKDNRIIRVHSFNTRIVGDALYVNFQVDTFTHEVLNIQQDWSFG